MSKIFLKQTKIIKCIQTDRLAIYFMSGGREGCDHVNRICTNKAI